MASITDQRDFHLRWHALGLPQRPGPSVVEAMRALLADCDTLQLGVTPEIAHVSRAGTAVDWDEEMIRAAWPGDCATHRAQLGDWMALPIDDSSVPAVFGDGCLTMLDWPRSYPPFLGEVRRVLAPGGRLILRCFVGPDEDDPIERIVRDAFAGRIACFGAFKMRLNMASFRTSGDARNDGARIHRLFQAHFPDRTELSAATGWSLTEIAAIDVYAGAPSVHNYPTREQIVSQLPSGARYRFVETAGYPLAERCPLLIVDFPG